jgi:membrane fusion protein
MTARPALFRQEALDFQQRHRQWGNVGALQPLSSKVTTWFLTGVTVLSVAFLCIGEYSRKETAVGYLTPTRGTAKIFVPQRGTIRDVHVKEGDLVQEGQALLTIETNQIAADGIDVNATLLDTLLAQKEVVAKNVVAEEQRTHSERDRLDSLIRGLETEIGELEAQIAILKDRLQIATDDLAASDQLRSKGFVSALESRRRRALVLEHKQALGALHQQVAARRNQLTEMRFTLRQLPTVMAQKIQNLRSELSATEQRITEINARRAYVIRAPAFGRVSTLQATVGQTANPQRLQLEIIPEDALMQAELFVPARAIGFVEVGQPVRILYEAFPYQHFGTYRGHVVNVSQTILTSQDAVGPIEIKEPAYRVTAALERSEIEAFGKKLNLQPDMLLKADIILENRSLMNWLISPIRGVRM